VKKSVSPAAAIALIVVVVIIAVFMFARAAKTSKKQFIPGVGVIDPKTGQPMRPEGAGRERGGGGGRGQRGGAEAGQE
jgi:hypothetical protein